MPSTRGISNRSSRGGRSYGRRVSKIHKNPIGSHGNISRCRICESINHWEDDCPDNPYGKSKGSTEEVVLYQSVLHTQEFKQQFTGETSSAAALDSGATSSVRGKTWIDCYDKTLSDEDQLKVTKASSSRNFKFGGGWKVAFVEKVTLPATIGEQPGRIRIDVAREEIPLLLSKKSMKKAGTNIDFKTDTVSKFGSQQKLIATSSGHYAVPLGQRAR